MESRKWKLRAIFGLVAITNLPDIPLKFLESVRYRAEFQELERDWVHDMREVVNKGERIAFLPWRNDFLVNYLASRLDVISYNIGGDKNLAEARRHWPKTMQLFPAETFDTDFAKRVIHLLAEGEADRVILPYIDTRWAAHQWPYPPEFKQSVSLVLNELKENKSVEIIERNYYVSVKLTCDQLVQ